MRRLELAVAVCRLTAGKLMHKIPVSGAYAEYHGKRFLILFAGPDWAALRDDSSADIPDGFDRGKSQSTHGRDESWVKVPLAALGAVIDVDVSGTVAGHTVSLRQHTANGQIRVWFVGPPDVAEELGLDGDQYMGWTGLFKPEDFDDIHVEETRRA